MNPILLSLGPFQVRWYGLLMAFAFLLGLFILRKLAGEKGIEKDLMDHYLIWMIIGIIGGARVFEILVYQPVYYFSNPLEMLFIWHGGLASHGGLLGGALVTWLFTRKHKIKFYDLADMAVIPIALGAAFVRIGNFVNGEIVGRVSSVPWAMEFRGYEGLRHPSQLYEAFKNVLLFFILFKMRLVKSLKRGTLFWSFIGIYSVFRFIVEFFKEFQSLDPSYVLTMGQWVSIPLMIVSGIMIWRINK